MVPAIFAPANAGFLKASAGTFLGTLLTRGIQRSALGIITSAATPGRKSAEPTLLQRWL